MAKVAVGGANGLIDRLLSLVGWKATSNTADQERIDCLNALNFAEQFIAQAEALSYLRTLGSLTANAATVAIPSDMDIGKDYTIENSAGTNIVEYKAPDEFVRHAAPSFDRIVATVAIHTLVVDAGATKFRFKPTPGAPETLPITYQKIPPALTDAGGSTSVLPEGYELTLLIVIAEQYIKRRRNAIDADFLDAQTKDMLSAFYDKFRDNKKTTTTDQGRERRKVDEDQLAPGR